MIDRELLELAAKAAGVDVIVNEDTGTFWMRLQPEQKVNRTWNPLIDDGDALRLAVKLGMDIGVADNEVCALPFDHPACIETVDGDPYAATRRAIVRAAAEIGRAER